MDGEKCAEQRTAKPPAEPEDHERTLKGRGRKRIFTSDQLQKAREMKQAGKSNNEIAKVLYGTATPTAGQRRSVSTTLEYHFGSKK